MYTAQMIEGLVETAATTIALLTELGGWAYGLVFIVALLDATVIIGHFVTSAPFLVIAGMLAVDGAYNISLLIVIAAIGASLGDGISYIAGRYSALYVHRVPKQISPQHIQRGLDFFKKYGDRSVFIGHFLGPLHCVIPFLAGMSLMDTAQFWLWNILGAIVWAITFVGGGYLISDFLLNALFVR